MDVKLDSLPNTWIRLKLVGWAGLAGKHTRAALAPVDGDGGVGFLSRSIQHAQARYEGGWYSGVA